MPTVGVETGKTALSGRFGERRRAFVWSDPAVRHLLLTEPTRAFPASRELWDSWSGCTCSGHEFSGVETRRRSTKQRLWDSPQEEQQCCQLSEFLLRGVTSFHVMDIVHICIINAIPLESQIILHSAVSQGY